MSYQRSTVVRCTKCEEHVTGTEHGFHRYSEEGLNVRVSLLGCPECGSYFVVKYYGADVPDRYGRAAIDWDPPVIILPAETVTLDKSVPDEIAGSYKEAQRVLSHASGYTAAAIMCRRTLEGMCENQAAHGATLKAKLEDLRNRGIIEAKLFEWADDVLRALGNDAAHDVSVMITKQDAEDALDFTRALIEYLYVFQPAFQRFRARRTKP